jgi:hypothetical protein
MNAWFKKYFIPHLGNDHKPHILRGETAVIIIAFVLVAELFFLMGTFVIGPKLKFTGSILPAVVMDMTNDERKSGGVGELVPNDILSLAARNKAADMAERGYFAHRSPDGRDPWYWLDEAGYEYSYAGENLAVNFIDSKDVVDAWMRSESHRENIMKSSFSDIGVGIARGMYKGKEAMFIVQFFASPRLVPHNDVISLPPVLASYEAPEEEAVDIGSEVAGESISVSPSPAREVVSPLSVAAASPRNSMNIVYLIILTIISLAVALAVFVKINVQHPALIVNGGVMIIVVSAMMAVNYWLLVSQGKVF